MNGCVCEVKKCWWNMVSKILLIVGGLNWGLVGIGMLLGYDNWNVVEMIFGNISGLSSIVYLLVGVSAVLQIFGCKCGGCDCSSPKETTQQM